MPFPLGVGRSFVCSATSSIAVVRVSVWALALFCAVVGIVLAAQSPALLDYALAKTARAATRPAVSFLGPEHLPRIAIRAQAVGVALLLAGILLVVLRRAVCSYVFATASSFRPLGRAFAEGLRLGEREDAGHFLTLLVIGLLAIVLRAWFLLQPIRCDEASTFLRFVSKPMVVGLAYYESPNNHLFHTLLAHVSTLLFGTAPWALRLPAFLAGVLMVPASYCAARLLFNRHAALLAAGFVASSSWLVEYSTNARGYTLVGLIFLLLLSVAAILRKNRIGAAWFVFVVLSSLGFFTMPIMLLPVGSVAVWLLLGAWKSQGEMRLPRMIRDLAAHGLAAMLLVGLFYTPAIVACGFRAIVANEIVEPRSFGYVLGHLPASLCSVWSLWNRDLPVIMTWILGAAFAASLLFHKRLSRGGVPLAAACLLWCLPVIVLGRVVPYERVWLFLLPLYLITASAGLSLCLTTMESRYERASRPLTPALAMVISLALAISVVRANSVRSSPETGTLRDAESIVLGLRGDLRPGDRIFCVSPSGPPLEYYFRRHGLPINYLKVPCRSAERILLVINEAHGQTLNGILEETGCIRADFPAPTLIHRYDSASVYSMRRIAVPR